MKYISFIKPKWTTRKEYQSFRNKRLIKIQDSLDTMYNKYGYELRIPIDVAYDELPFFVKQIDSIVHKNKIPDNAEFNELRKDLIGIFLYAEKYKNNNWDFPILKKEIKTLLFTYYNDSTIRQNKTTNSDWIASQIEINEFSYGTKRKDSINFYLHDMLVKRLKVSFYLALSEYGIYLSGQIPFINDNLQTADLEKKLIMARKQKNKTKIAIIEKQLIDELVRVVNLYHIRQEKIIPFEEYITPVIEQTAPTYIINKMIPACGGLVIITQHYLEKWGISSENIFIEGFLNGHILTRVKTANNKAYIIDILRLQDTVSQEIALKR